MGFKHGPNTQSNYAEFLLDLRGTRSTFLSRFLKNVLGKISRWIKKDAEKLKTKWQA